LGINEKKVRLNGRLLYSSAVKFENTTNGSVAETLFKDFLSEKDFMEIATSGSTGSPKLIRLYKEHMRASASKTLNFLKLEAGSRSLLCLPPERIGGLMMLIRWWEGDLDLHMVSPQASPLEELEGNFDFAAMVPYQVTHSLTQLHRVHKLIIGGGAIPPELEQKLKDHAGEIWHTYGMTETISHVAMRRVNGPDDDVFQAMPGVRFSVDERQCLIINSPDIGMENLVTNDVVELVTNTSFQWLGRYDNVVNSGGVKLYPEFIEQKIGEWHHSFFLAGVPDNTLGEKLVLLIEGPDITDIGELQARFSKLDRYEIPKEIKVVPKFEYTANGKLNRPQTLLKI